MVNFIKLYYNNFKVHDGYVMQAPNYMLQYHETENTIYVVSLLDLG